MTQLDLFPVVDRGAKVRTLINQLVCLAHTDRPATFAELLANDTIRQAKEIREQYHAGDLTAEEAELKLLNLKHALEKERREKASQEAGFTPQLLNPEDTGELF